MLKNPQFGKTRPSWICVDWKPHALCLEQGTNSANTPVKECWTCFAIARFHMHVAARLVWSWLFNIKQNFMVIQSIHQDSNPDLVEEPFRYQKQRHVALQTRTLTEPGFWSQPQTQLRLNFSNSWKKQTESSTAESGGGQKLVESFIFLTTELIGFCQALVF